MSTNSNLSANCPSTSPTDSGEAKKLSPEGQSLIKAWNEDQAAVRDKHKAYNSYDVSKAIGSRSVAFSAASSWDEGKHPRVASGEHGGEFASKPAVGRSKNSVEFSKPITGPSGASIRAYDWQYKLEEDGVDKRGESITRRVSDWDASASNPETGREIVHHFRVTDPDDKSRVVSLESALSILGYDKGDAGAKGIKSIVSTLKNRAKAQMTLDHQKDVISRYEEADSDALSRALKMPMPEIEHQKFLSGKDHWEIKIGDAYQAYFSSIDTTENERKKGMAISDAKKSWIEKRRNELIAPEIRKEADETFGVNASLYTMKQHVKDTEKRIEKLDKKISAFKGEE